MVNHLQEIGNWSIKDYVQYSFSSKFSFQEERYYLFPLTEDRNFWNPVEEEGEGKKRIKERQPLSARTPEHRYWNHMA